MEVSKISFSTQTKQLLDNGYMTPKRKKTMRKQRIKEFILSQPVGTKLSIVDIMTAGGYNSKQTSSGYGFVYRMLRDKQIERAYKPAKHNEKTPWTVPGTVTTIQPRQSLVTFKTIPKTTHENFISGSVDMWPEIKKPIIVKEPTITSGSEDFKEKAILFAWQHNSDSLRDFISTL